MSKILNIDTDMLANIYVDSYYKKYDILATDLDYSDKFYEEVIDEQILYNHGIELCESFKILEKNRKTQYGHQDVYETESNGFIFNVTITYQLAKYYEETISKNFTMSEMYFDNETQENLKIIKNIIQSNLNKYVAIIEFRDKDNNINLTGKVGYYTSGVLTSIKAAFFDSFFKNNEHSKNTIILLILTNKNEPKCMKLFSKLITKFLPQFNKEILDLKTDSKYNKIYRYN